MTAASDPEPDRVLPADVVLAVCDLRAYYQMHYFGVTREVRAVDGITLHVNRNEIYGLAGESSSGKTSFIKSIAAAYDQVGLFAAFEVVLFVLILTAGLGYAWWRGALEWT